MGEAQALRAVGRSGWRRHALANLETLAHSRAADKDVLALRAEAVACLTAPDLRREASLPTARLRSLAFSPDGRYLAALSNTAVVVWDMQTLKPLRTIPTSPVGPRNHQRKD